MTNYRKYGDPPFKIVVVHGGPGAAGEMKPVALEISHTHGVLEPLQTANSVKKQLLELKDTVQSQGNPPVKLIGWSWGAWLSFIMAATYPALVEKLILVSSGSFAEEYAMDAMKTRLKRLNQDEIAALQVLNHALSNPAVENRDRLFENLGRLFDKTDTYAAIHAEPDVILSSFAIYQAVWPQAAELRRKGKLLNMAEKIRCPVVAIHGNYDPHPAAGVRKPLQKTVKNFRFISLNKCGHKPWVEKEARDKFYAILKKELAEVK
jgi:pimeloyl-ACP methyl ester carboxylesterase